MAKAIAALPKSNNSRPRVVVITAGADATHVAFSDSEEVKVFNVDKLPDDQIVDTNGAGDAFAGGFIGAITAGKTVDEAVEAGHKLGKMCVGQVSAYDEVE